MHVESQVFGIQRFVADLIYVKHLTSVPLRPDEMLRGLPCKPAIVAVTLNGNTFKNLHAVAGQWSGY
jgi:hypothetical protein